jgi:hypothetical protein
LIDLEDGQSSEDDDEITLDVKLNGVDLHASGDNVFKLLVLAAILILAEYFFL